MKMERKRKRRKNSQCQMVPCLFLLIFFTVSERLRGSETSSSRASQTSLYIRIFQMVCCGMKFLVPSSRISDILVGLGRAPKFVSL